MTSAREERRGETKRRGQIKKEKAREEKKGESLISVKEKGLSGVVSRLTCLGGEHFMPLSWTAAVCPTVGGDVGVRKVDLLGQPR